MTDIVERLRDWIPEREIENHWTIDFDALDAERKEAADEIERMREVVKVQANAAKMIDSAWAKEINYHRERKNDYDIAISTLDSEREANKLLTAEIERMRKALKEISAMDEVTILDWKFGDVWQHQKVARAALEGK
jgi:hypothetical protein